MSARVSGGARRTGWPPAYALAGTLLALSALSCRGRAAEDPKGGFSPAPVLLVAVDGMEWNAVLPALRQGRLKTIARLMREGSYGLLETRRGLRSPALWTSVATGKSVEKHGIRDFVKSRKPTTFFESTDRRTKAFWNILSEHGRRVYVIGWFVTYPVEPVEGVMVAQTNTTASLRVERPLKGSLQPGIERQVFPVERQEDFFRIAHAANRDVPSMLGELARVPLASLAPEVRQRLEKVSWAIRADAIYRRIALHLLEDGPPPDLLAVYFGALDVTSHQFWPYRPPDNRLWSWVDEARARSLGRRFAPGSFADVLLGDFYWRLLTPPEIPGLGPIVSRAYEALDQALAALLERLPRDTTVILVSDHGFRPWGHGDGPPALLVAAGPNIRRMAGPPPARLVRARLRVLGSIDDVTPTLLTLFEIPVGRDMDGRPLEALLQPSRPERRRPEPLATHDTPEWLAARARGGLPPSSADEERLEQLRALGYIK